MKKAVVWLCNFCPDFVLLFHTPQIQKSMKYRGLAACVDMHASAFPLDETHHQMCKQNGTYGGTFTRRKPKEGRLSDEMMFLCSKSPSPS